MNEKHEHQHFEYAHTRCDREFAGADDIRRGLARLQAGEMCSECRWQRASVLVRHRILMCRRCADVDHTVRSVEAIHLQRLRKQTGNRGQQS